ncbi:MAG: helix-turn-helix transcriptional regulator [Anaerolineae bacterium]|nr:helix-turn-helix transcriptional regulator [Anaerolineae bacterium]
MGKLINKIPELLIYKVMRDKQRYSQRAMAQGTDLTDSAISRILRYKTLDNVPLGNIIKIAQWLEVSPLGCMRKAILDLRC